MASLPIGLDRAMMSLIRGARQRRMSWPAMVERARTCGILPLFLDVAARGGAENCGASPRELAALVASERISQTARCALWRYTLRAVQTCLDGMPCIVLKGLPCGARLMGDAARRESNDVDVWIEQARCREATQALSDAGFRCAVEPHWWATNQMLLVHPVLAPVEIHWLPAPPPFVAPSFDEAYARAAFDDSTGCRVPGDADLWVFLLLHALQHYFALKTTCDLIAASEVLEIHGVDLDGAAARYGLGRLSRHVRRAARGFDGHPAWETRVMKSALRAMFEGKAPTGRLILGEDSKALAALGVAMRVGEMALLDGWRYPLRAATQALWKGPHRLGALVSRWHDP